MSDDDFYDLKAGDEVVVVAFTLHSRYTVTAKAIGKSCTKIQVVYPDGRVSWKSKKVVMMKGVR